jgi:hypothetical protein
MSNDYKMYSLPREGNWVRSEIVAETPEGKQAGIADFKGKWQVYDGRVEHETGTTAVVRRFYKM